MKEHLTSVHEEKKSCECEIFNIKFSIYKVTSYMEKRNFRNHSSKKELCSVSTTLYVSAEWSCCYYKAALARTLATSNQGLLGQM